MSKQGCIENFTEHASLFNYMLSLIKDQGIIKNERSKNYDNTSNQPKDSLDTNTSIKIKTFIEHYSSYTQAI